MLLAYNFPATLTQLLPSSIALVAANQRHSVLCQLFQQAAAKVSPHTIILGVGRTHSVGGAIYTPCSIWNLPRILVSILRLLSSLR